MANYELKVIYLAREMDFYEVEAETEAEAVEKFRGGEAELMDRDLIDYDDEEISVKLSGEKSWKRIKS